MKKKGAALLVVVIITSVLFVVAVTLMDRSVRTYRDTVDMINGKKAYYAAESLIYDSIGYVNTVDVPLDAAGSSPVNLLAAPNFKRLAVDSDINVRSLLISKVQQTSTGQITRKTYNVSSEVRYGDMAFVVRMQVETVFLSGSYSTYSILDRKTYKYRP